MASSAACNLLFFVVRSSGQLTSTQNRVAVFASKSGGTVSDKDDAWLKWAFYILAIGLGALGVIFIIFGCKEGETNEMSKDKLLERDKDAKPIAIPVTVPVAVA